MAHNPAYSQTSQRPHDEPALQRYEPQFQQFDHRDTNLPQDYTPGYQEYNEEVRRNNYTPMNQMRYNQSPYQQNYPDGPRAIPMQQGRAAIPAEPRPSTADGMRARYDPIASEKGRIYPNSGPGRPGMKPPPIDRSGSADHAGIRKPLKSPTLSPDQPAWDSPFPTFPGTQKKTSFTQEKEILEQMSAMEIGGTSQVLPRNNRRKGSQEKPVKPRGPSSINETEQSKDNSLRREPTEYNTQMNPEQRNLHRGYPPQGLPQRGYSDADLDAPKPGNNISIPTPTPLRRTPTMPVQNSFGTAMTSNEPASRGMPPRPSTASSNRPPPHNYQSRMSPMPLTLKTNELSLNQSVGGPYGDYYGKNDLAGTQSSNMEMPDFNVNSPQSHKRGASFEAHIQVPVQKQNNVYREFKSSSFQPNMPEQGQTFPTVYEIAENSLNDYEYQTNFANGYGNDHSSQRYEPLTPHQGYNEQYLSNPIQDFQPPPRTSSTASNSNIGTAHNGEMTDSGQIYSNNFYGQASDDNLPSHPMPVRPGLISNSNMAQINNKPAPIRNYNNASPIQQAPWTSPDAVAVEKDLTGEIEYLRNTIKINPTDQASQLLLAKHLVDSTTTLVQNIPDQRSRNKAREKYVAEALRLLKKLVANQNIEAMFYLADCYGRGASGLEVDHKEAFSLYQSAAKAGHAAAAYRTAVCCELGHEEGGGTRKDPSKAIQWYKRAAMLGDTPAMYKIGIVLLKGLLGQPRNPREAIGWLKRAAERADAENPHALHELALLYEQPQSSENSVIRDEAYSFQLFQQAADLGYKFSQFRLGCAYEYGLFNCPIDPKLSILWYSRAAAQGEHQAELALSGWYLTGSEGVLQQNDTEAYLWARKAAMAGLAKAEYAMGYFTEVGIGSPANLDDAKRWYWRAAAQNFPKARERLEDLKRGGSKAVLRSREKISGSKKNSKGVFY